MIQLCKELQTKVILESFFDKLTSPSKIVFVIILS